MGASGSSQDLCEDLLIQRNHQLQITIVVIQGRLGCGTSPNDMCVVFICLLQQILSLARTCAARLAVGVLPAETCDVRCNFDV
jgi:hypothetical protein